MKRLSDIRCEMNYDKKTDTYFFGGGSILMRLHSDNRNRGGCNGGRYRF